MVESHLLSNHGTVLVLIEYRVMPYLCSIMLALSSYWGRLSVVFIIYPRKHAGVFRHTDEQD